jgi:polysaccharide export outer membrane protein
MKLTSVLNGLAVTLLMACVSHGALSEDYRLRPGDTIEVSVTGVPDMRQRYTIDVDGQISAGLVGELNAAGLTAAELREKLQKILTTKEVRLATTDGHEFRRSIEADEVTVNVVEYRPVYLKGDVSKPGEQRFRPDMTVRQAVALAGGYDILRYRLGAPLTDGANFQADYETLWVEYARVLVRLARLHAELGTGDLDKFTFPNLPVAKEVLADLLATEKQQLATSRADHDKEVAFLQGATTNATKQVAILDEQYEKEKQGVESDAGQINRLLEYNQKGTVTTDRIVAERRSLLISSTRLLQTTAQRSQVIREREELLRRIDRDEDARKLQLVQQMEDAQTSLASIRIRAKAAAEKLLYTGALQSKAARSQPPEIVVVRRGPDGFQQIAATEDTVLQPGDAVEVTLKVDFAEGVPVR